MPAKRLPGVMLALDQPQERSRGFRVILVACLVLFAATWPVALSVAGTPLPLNQGAIASASAWVVAAIGGAIAILLWWHGLGTGRRGYLILSATWAYGTACLAVFPFTYPNALRLVDPPAPMIGAYQSGAWLLNVTEIAFLAAIPFGAVVIDRDQRSSRPARLTHEPWSYALGALVAFGATLLVAIPLVDRLPKVIGEVGQMPRGVIGVVAVMIALGVCGLVVVGWLARHGSMITQWIFVVLLIEFGTVLVVFGGGRGSLGWLWGKAWPMVAMSVMLVALLWALTRIGRATEDLAYQDWLTGAQSRVRLERDLDEVGSRDPGACDGASLIRLDLDSFQVVNNQFGHETGDEILLQAASRITGLVGERAQVARLGGDEFGVLLHWADPGTDAEVEALAGRLLEQMRQPYRVGEATIRLSASAGIAATGESGPASELLAMTDLALSQAKEAGGNCSIWYSRAMGEQAAQDAELHQALAVAIASAAFDLDYQPVVEIGTGRCRGAEALVRWVRDGARVSAGKFIQYAEASGQIVEIGTQVLNRLEHDAPIILSAAEPDFLLHVNLSVRELTTDELVGRYIRGPLAALCDRIVIEVTESQTTASLADPAGPLASLTAAGYRLAIDDFGTGYSNLARLASLRPEIIKMDRSLAMATNTGATRLLRAAVAVCVAVDATTIIEGVETSEQAAQLAALGITQAQGYLFARPMPMAALLDQGCLRPRSRG